MNFKKVLVAALPAMLLASCASDEPTVGPGSDDTGGKAMYAKIQIKVPSTRSSTIEPDDNTNSSDGYEIGKDYENNIDDVVVVLATKKADGSYVPCATGAAYTQVSTMPDPNEDNVYTILFKDEDIVKLAKEDVYLFAYCNSQLTDASFATETDLSDMTTEIASAAKGQGIWQPRHFMMVNAPNKLVPSITLPDSTALRNSYNSAEKALDLGTIDVARTAARFDFKPTNENKYTIVDNSNPNSTDHKVLANVELVAMAPLNIAKKFYTLPRVSADGTDNAWEICGKEGISNYVVSPFFTEKAATTLATSLFDNFFFKTGTMPNYDSDVFEYDPINTWYEAATDDNDENWTANDKDGYKIWRYVTENTIPGNASNQRTGISTGIVFKAKITAADNTTLLGKALTDATKPIYFYGGTCYGTLADMRKTVAKLDPNAQMRKDFVAVFSEEYLVYEDKKDETDHTINRVYKVSDDKLVDCESTDNVITAGEGTKNVFKILRPINGEYFVYYVYRNRHNDNQRPSVMRPMEFATVRNNVYKLAVSVITDFGHTADPKDDYEPEKPDNPNEEPKTYFRVSCRVLPWVVRVNNIEF